MKLISIVTPCYNEEANVEEIHRQVKAIFDEIPNYRYEHIFIDNASTDNTVAILKKIAEQDSHAKVIVNARNFGHIRSPYHAMLETNGDATILIVADLQDPPAMIKEFIQKWEQGYKIVVGVKPESQESKLMFAIRRAYYNFVTRIADVKLIKNFTGFGLYDKEVIDILRTHKDPYPYFRGLIAEIGLEIAEVPYNQPRRARGVTKNNFYSLYDMAMLGITSHSKIPLRLATMAGFSLSIISLLISLSFFVLKLFFWNSFNLGVAPILIGLFFFSSVQLFFIGLLGEYIASIHTRVTKRPLVVEKERINFSQ
ncbi:glycosyl transferase, group 2 family protein [Legionella nautarum]|uniref:Glycosyl transferase, group 2 family protein n=1 Tax=Legionella nautarum TaxID=45070 RepID=A0A0W0WW16_9GAMM|nr:glycosyltransferase family 2 protein [Legionella nautarum]KTD36422.1 glycosyl transferase, group 2 family protein [Legionella nautarum]